MYHKFKVVKYMTKGEISRREKQLEEERKAALRDYGSAKSAFEGQFFTAMSAETMKMFADGERLLAMEGWTDTTAVTKADLEVCYGKSMFNDYHKSVNRNYMSMST